jgi:hypothetical protein
MLHNGKSPWCSERTVVSYAQFVPEHVWGRQQWQVLRNLFKWSFVSRNSAFVAGQGPTARSDQESDTDRAQEQPNRGLEMARDKISFDSYSRGDG